MIFWDEKEAKRLSQELPFNNTFIAKTRIKHLNNITLLHKRPFYDELSIEKISKAFKTYERSYKTGIVDSKDQSVQLTASKSSIKDLLKTYWVKLTALNMK